MKIKDWMKLGFGIYVAKATYNWAKIFDLHILKLVDKKIDKINEKLKDSKPKNEEES